MPSLPPAVTAGSDRGRLTLANRRESLTKRQSSGDDFPLHTQVKAP